MGWRDRAKPVETPPSWKERAELVDTGRPTITLEEPIDVSPPSRIDRIKQAYADTADERGSIRSALRTLSPLLGGLMAGAEEAGALLGEDSATGRVLYRLGSGQRMLSEEEIAALPPEQQQAVRRRQMPGLQAAYLEGRDIVEGVPAAFEAAKEQPGEFAKDMVMGAIEGGIRTSARGGLRREAPISSTGDLLTVTGAPGTIAKVKNAVTALPKAGARQLAESTATSAQQLRALDRAQDATRAGRDVAIIKNTIKGNEALMRYRQAVDEALEAKTAYEAALGKRLEVTPEISELESARFFFSKALDDAAAPELARQAGKDAWAARLASPETANVNAARGRFKAATREAVRLRDEANKAGLSELMKQQRPAEMRAANASRVRDVAKNRAEDMAAKGGIPQAGVDWLLEKTPKVLRPSTARMDAISEWLRVRGLPSTPGNVKAAAAALGIEALEEGARGSTVPALSPLLGEESAEDERKRKKPAAVAALRPLLGGR